MHTHDAKSDLFTFKILGDARACCGDHATTKEPGRTKHRTACRNRAHRSGGRSTTLPRVARTVKLERAPSLAELRSHPETTSGIDPKLELKETCYSGVDHQSVAARSCEVYNPQKDHGRTESGTRATHGKIVVESHPRRDADCLRASDSHTLAARQDAEASPATRDLRGAT